MIRAHCIAFFILKAEDPAGLFLFPIVNIFWGCWNMGLYFWFIYAIILFALEIFPGG